MSKCYLEMSQIVFLFCLQSERADNVMQVTNKQEAVDKIRLDIRDFKDKNKLDKVRILSLF